MSMQTLSVARLCDPEQSLGFKNLVVGGCSFTSNFHNPRARSWPYFLRDLGGFDQVYDCSMPGAGNHHIHSSVIFGLEQQPLPANQTLVVIMWSGNDRDDYIIDTKHLNEYPHRYNYTDTVATGITGGTAPESCSNIEPDAFAQVKQVKSRQSRAVENYVAVAGLYHYLKSKGYATVFVEYRPGNLPGRDLNFDIRPELPSTVKSQYDAMIADIPNFYQFCLRQDLLGPDDYHPRPEGHLAWTRQILLPALAKMPLTQHN